MQKILNLPMPNRKVKLWFNELPDIELMDNFTETIVSTDCTEDILLQKCAIELTNPLHASNYGLLGLVYTPKYDKHDVEIIVSYADKNKKLYDETISHNKSTVYIGLPKEYVDCILDTAKDYIVNKNNIPAGILNFKVAANCEVGSSINIFKRLAEILLDMMQVDFESISDGELTDIILSTVVKR